MVIDAKARLIERVREQMRVQRKSIRKVANAIGISPTTVHYFLNSGKATTKNNQNAILRVLGLNEDAQIDELETAASLEDARTEKAVLTAMALEGTALEMEHEQDALSELSALVHKRGATDSFGNLAWRDLVIVKGELLEVGDDGAFPVTAARAEQILGGL